MNGTEYKPYVIDTGYLFPPSRLVGTSWDLRMRHKGESP